MNRRALFWNALSGTGLYLVSSSMAFMMSPFLVHHLGNGGYGFWELLLGLVGYLGVLDMGIGPAVVRHVAVARGANDHPLLVRVINTGVVTFMGAGLLGALVVLLATISPKLVFGSMPLSLGESRQVISIAAIIFFLTFTRSTFAAALMGFQYHRVINAVRSILALVQALAIYLILRHNDSHALRTLAIVSCLGLSCEIAFTSYMLIRVCKVPLSLAKASLSEGKALFRFGAKSAGIMASSSLMRQGLLFVLSHSLGAASVTFYVLCGRLIDYGVSLLSAIGFPITPYLAATLGHKGEEGLKASFDYTTRIIQFILAGASTGIFWLGLPFLARWMGPDYAVRGKWVFYILVGAWTVTLIGANSNRTLMSLNKHGKAATGGVVFALCFFALSFLLIPHFGLPGAAACSGLFLVSQNMLEFYLVSKALEIPKRTRILNTLKRVAAPMLACSLILSVLALYNPPLTYARIALHSLIGGLGYTVVSIFTILKRTERMSLWGALGKRLRRQVQSAQPLA